jgi:hypothetical protein
MKIPLLIFALAGLALPTSALCDELGGTPPEKWVECFSATKLHQEFVASSGKASLNVILKVGEPRVAYQKLAKHWLTGFKKLDAEAAAGEMVKAPAEMKKNKTLEQIEDLARTCTINLPDLSNPMFYQKYPFLAD